MNVLEQIYAKAKENPQKVAFPEASNEKMMQAAYETGKEGYIIPVLVGEAEKLKELAEERGYDPSVFSFVDIHDETYTNDVIRRYVELPDTIFKEKAIGRRMQDPLYYAMAMQKVGDADVTFAGIDNTTGDVLLAGQMIIGMKPGISTISSIGLADIPGYEAVKALFWLSVTVQCVQTRMLSSWQASQYQRVTRCRNFLLGAEMCDGMLFYTWKWSGRTD